MNSPLTTQRGVRGLAWCGLFLTMALAIAGCGGKPAAPPGPAKPKAEAGKTNAVAAAGATAVQLTSVFEDVLPPKVKDPFYPGSKRRQPAAPVSNNGVPIHVEPQLVLKACIRTSKHNQAIVNNAVLEVGDPPESIRIPGGHATVRCLEVGNDYAIIQVEGEPEPKRLPLSQKKN